MSGPELDLPALVTLEGGVQLLLLLRVDVVVADALWQGLNNIDPIKYHNTTGGFNTLASIL